jgi:hypothetical protein
MRFASHVVVPWLRQRVSNRFKGVPLENKGAQEEPRAALMSMKRIGFINPLYFSVPLCLPNIA